METAVTVGVPAENEDDLNDLLDAFAEPPTRLEARPFDGAVLIALAGILSSGGVKVLVAWIESRVEARKQMSLTISGVEASGYTMKELEPVIKLLTADEQTD